MSGIICSGLGLQLLTSILVLGWINVGCAASSRYALIADAGSTSTRVYLFHLYSDGTDPAKVQISDVGKGPALSSFHENPSQAANAVRPQLEKAAGLIPEEMRAAVPVSVFATAGMRLVPLKEQEAIYAGLSQGLLQSNYTFARDQFHARTISGREEGIFALIAANYLANRLYLTLESAASPLMGVLDLGGSSTQVAHPPDISVGESLVPKLGEDHTFVRSFLKLGMEKMRQRTYSGYVEEAHPVVRAKRAVPNPCSFYGYSEPEEPWRGTGEASKCEESIAALLKAEQEGCEAQATSDVCLRSDMIPEQAATSSTSTRFFLISGYLYVTDFVRWWLEQPGVRTDEFEVLRGPDAFTTPTIAELRAAATVLCAENWERLTSIASDPTRRHKFTKDHKVPHRCFEVNYINALLSTGYGFGENERIFKIVEDIDGSEIEWTLGAFLHDLASPGSNRRQEL